MQAAFLQHEGYLGALGALMSYGDPGDKNLSLPILRAPTILIDEYM